MKRLMVAVMVLGFLVVNTGVVFAGWFSKEQPEVTKTTTVVKSVSVAQKAVGNSQEAVSKKKAEVNNTIWVVEISPMSGKGKAEKDVISFADNKVGSKNMGARGFAATNYSMRLLDDNETYTWETMQVSEKEGVAFWRGDIGPDGIMRGVVSIRNKKEIVSDFNFHSVEVNKTAPVQVTQ
jgi:hypothetical protein